MAYSKSPGPAKVLRWLPLFLAVATLALNGEGLLRSLGRLPMVRSTWGGRGYRSSGDLVDLPRRMVETHLPPGTRLHVVCARPEGPTAIERSVHLAVSWALSPTPVAIGPASAIGDVDAVLASSYGPAPRIPADGRPPLPRLEKRDEAGAMVLWVRPGRRGKESAGPPAPLAPPGPLREAIGLLPVLWLAAAGALFCGWTGALSAVLLFSIGMALPPLAGFRPMPLYVAACSLLGLLAIPFLPPPAEGAPEENGRPGEGRPHAIAAALLLAVLCATMALSHTFMAPNGLGVSGGKAKLFFMAGGLPEGFFHDPARSTLQPAYPPGLALLTLGCYGFAGGCGEWLTQMLGVFAMAAVLLFLSSRSPAPRMVPWLLAAFLTPSLLQVATLYYAEPLMALYLLVGRERLRRKDDDRLGWLLAGAAGFFKNEGLVLFLALWLALRLLGGGRRASLRGLALGAALPLLWHLGCRLAGASLYDFAPLLRPNPSQWLAATGYALDRLLLHPWEYGFAFPAALVAYGATCRKAPRSPLATVLLAFLLSLTAFTAIYAFSAAPDFPWHLRTSMGRLLWTPSLLLLRELVGVLRLDGPRV